MLGRKIWLFPDGELPPPGNKKPRGHESLIILNPNQKKARIAITVFYEDKAPEKIENLEVPGARVRCFRLDKPLGRKDYQIPVGQQYALMMESSIPVICQMGRMDIRQPNLAYYTTMGFSVLK